MQENKLRTVGTTDKLIDSLLVHFARGENHKHVDGRKSSVLSPSPVTKKLPPEAPPPPISAPRRLSSRPTSRNATSRASTLPPSAPPVPSTPRPPPARTVSATKSRFIEEGLTTGNHLNVPPSATTRRIRTSPESGTQPSTYDGSLSPTVHDVEPLPYEHNRHVSKGVKSRHMQEQSGASTWNDTETSASPSTSPRSKRATELVIDDRSKSLPPPVGENEAVAKKASARSPIQRTSSAVRVSKPTKPNLPPPPPSKSPGPSKPDVPRTKTPSSKPAPPLPQSHSILSALEARLDSYTNAVRASEDRLKTQQTEMMDMVKKLQNRIDAQETLIQTQHHLIEELRQALLDTHEMAVQTRQSITDVRVDASSCVSQISFFSTSVSNLTKRTIAMEREVLQENGKLPKLEKELSEVDVAVESERDRVTDLEHKVTSLQKELELLGINGSNGVHGIGADHARSRMSSMGGMSAVSAPISRNGGVSTFPEVGRIIKSNRASISSGLHAPSIPSASPSPQPPEPSITITGVDETTAYPDNSGHRANLRADFEFPPKRPNSAILPNGARHINGSQNGTVFPRQSNGLLGMNSNRSLRSMITGSKVGLSATPPLSRKTSGLNEVQNRFIGEEPDLYGSPGWEDSIDGSLDLKGEVPLPQSRRRPGGGRKGNIRSFAGSEAGDTRSVISSFDAMSVSISDLDRMGDDDDSERRAFVLASQREEDEEEELNGRWHNTKRSDSLETQSGSEDDKMVDLTDEDDPNDTVVLSKPSAV
ncbi:hypothetical protein FRC02_007333 [Tulasnella sp. 418]|nr:hypothetical protein FRC02_007333 [Tulasnella sp. 418]